MSPEAMWRKREPIDAIAYAQDLSTLDQALGRVVRDARLTHKGIQFLGLTYRSPEVTVLLNHLLPRMSERKAHRGQATVKFKYHPEDISRVFVFDEITGDYVSIPCTEPRYTQALSEHHHQLIEAFARAEQLSFFTEDEKCAAKERLRQKVLSLIPASRIRDRRSAQRLLSPYGNENKSAPITPAQSNPYEIPIATVENRQDRGELPAPKPRNRRPTKRQGPTQAPFEPVLTVDQIATDNPFNDIDFGKLLEDAQTKKSSK